jgi:hypothetical protein
MKEQTNSIREFNQLQGNVFRRYFVRVLSNFLLEEKKLLSRVLNPEKMSSPHQRLGCAIAHSQVTNPDQGSLAPPHAPRLVTLLVRLEIHNHAMDLQVGLSKGYCHFLFYSPPSLGMI